MHTYADGGRFEGLMQHGVREGPGRFQYHFGDTYEGMYSNDLKVVGVWHYANGAARVCGGELTGELSGVSDSSTRMMHRCVFVGYNPSFWCHLCTEVVELRWFVVAHAICREVEIRRSRVCLTRPSPLLGQTRDHARTHATQRAARVNLPGSPATRLQKQRRTRTCTRSRST